MKIDPLVQAGLPVVGNWFIPALLVGTGHEHLGCASDDIATECGL